MPQKFGHLECEKKSSDRIEICMKHWQFMEGTEYITAYAFTQERPGGDPAKLTEQLAELSATDHHKGQESRRNPGTLRRQLMQPLTAG